LRLQKAHVCAPLGQGQCGGTSCIAAADHRDVRKMRAAEARLRLPKRHGRRPQRDILQLFQVGSHYALSYSGNCSTMSRTAVLDWTIITDNQAVNIILNNGIRNRPRTRSWIAWTLVQAKAGSYHPAQAQATHPKNRKMTVDTEYKPATPPESGEDRNFVTAL